ncbi:MULTISPECIES: class I SAM-dependent methyltransferase [Methylomonas]|nr:MULTISPECIES: class I SAM-dependent methyltransferase [Methylomonas]TCV83092.1 methyltransferase family protein [Methylomonas methanica]
MFDKDFEEIRAISSEMGCFSWTTREYQDDILNFLITNRHQGRGVVEVGCYKGGLSALLALVCEKFEWPFYTIDVDQSAIDSTRGLLERLNLDRVATIHLGDLGSFVSNTRLSERPALIILDGDHRYDAVVKDILDTYRLNMLPYAAVFHDFTLRHPTSGEKVDQAVRDCFGTDYPINPIGAKMIGDGKYPIKEKPSDDGHWWEVPGSEGAIVELPQNLVLPTIEKQKESWGFRSLLKRLFR